MRANFMIPNGTKESLMDKSHRPHFKHPNSHTDTEIKWINNYLRHNPNLSMIELYTKLRINRGYSRNPASLFRFLRKQSYYKKEQPKKKPYKPQPYDTPTELGIKWQVDVKYVSQNSKLLLCLTTRNSYNTQRLMRTQGNAFCTTMKTDKVHPVDQLCNSLGIRHQLIRPRTPHHNGKVERSHRNDNERFYRYLKFYSLDDLRYQGKLYLKRANYTVMTTLGYLTPLEMRTSLRKV